MYEKFVVNTYAFPHDSITETGRRSSYSGRYDINYSGILSRLIQEAGRFCERFASDLFIDWRGVESFIDSAHDGMAKSFLFGFRQNGVDHDSYIFSRYENDGDRARHEYRSLWRLDISCYENDEIEMTLGRVF